MNRIYKKLLITTVAVFAAAQCYQLQAAGSPGSGQYAQPGYDTGYRDNSSVNAGGRSPQRSQFQNTQPYGGPGSYPGSYNRGYPPPPYYGDRNYRRSGRSMPWDSGRGGRSMPWENKRGGRNMPWDSGRGGWMGKDKFGDTWDDMLNAPSDMGEMPGGWTAPSVSVPNPVDVGDEFEGAARDAPDQMRNVYDDNRRSNR